MKSRIFLTLLWLSFNVYAEVFQCQHENGSVVYQGMPCESEPWHHAAGSDQDLEKGLTELAEISGRSKQALGQLGVRKAIEAQYAEVSIKAYQSSQLFDYPAQVCGGQVAAQLMQFHQVAQNEIALGKHYYRDGINVRIGKQQFQHSARQLTDSLNQTLLQQRQQYQLLAPNEMHSKCVEEQTALAELLRQSTF
ncbi:hypothetical protein [Motilimonas pumila]|uniref:DUF4124 domain-containing protein n=1 Tax=Motilimonas pumila TaxID=2303987 RepID=A0A418YFS1_9GAMM|nr:hypothetical protein [Motilimonas pumila]RJG48159.1 hypothetical protein D1Z90_08820 [Motilimonas pumila]